MATADNEPGAEPAPVDASHQLQLCTRPLRFPPVDAATSVFYDEALRQVFTVRGGGMHVTVSSLDSPESTNLSFPSRGPVVSVKFSLDKRILAIQRTSRTIQFINMFGGSDMSEYSQTCKSKTPAHLLGFSWTGPNELVFFTNQGIELYQVNPERRSVKCLKTINVSTNWHIYSHESRTCVLSSTPYANVLHPFHFRPGTVTRYSKFEVELPAGHSQVGQKLAERDVSIAVIYGKLYLLLVKNNPKGSPGSPAEVSLCLLSKDGTSKQHTLALDQGGRFAVNVVDNLIVVHHQVSKTSALFDIRWNQRPAAPNERIVGRIPTHHPVAVPQSVAPVHLDPLAEGTFAGPAPNIGTGPCELYTPSWIIFQPNVVIDAKLGALWTVDLQLGPLVEQQQDKLIRVVDQHLLVELLLRRSGSKEVILQVVKSAIVPGTQCELDTISLIFDKLNAVVAAKLEGGRGGQDRRRGHQAVTQEDLYLTVFSKLDDADPPVPFKFMVATLIEYIRSLSFYGIPVEHYMYELVINLLVRHNRYYQLHQFLQYHVVKDSKHVRTYPPAFQLALDMFKRLGDANEEIFDVLLSKKQLLAALRFIRSIGPGAVASVSARRFLEAAFDSGDDVLFYTVYKFFEQRNIQLRKKPGFMKDEKCEKYEEHFQKLFGNCHEPE